MIGLIKILPLKLNLLPSNEKVTTIDYQWFICVLILFITFNCDLISGQLVDDDYDYTSLDDKDNLINSLWSHLNVTCENGLETWNSCHNQAVIYGSTLDNDDEDKLYCCTAWHLFNCWSYQVKTVCSDIDSQLMEQSRIILSNQSRCIKYYDLSICKAKPLPLWANILILSFGASLITGAAIFVYWRWIRLI